MSDNETTLALDLSAANPALLAALAKAQQAADTVGKDGWNDQRKYNYASAEAMVRAAREAMADTGLAIISTWTQVAAEPPEGGDIGNQFVCATVVEHFALTHAEGGVITGKAELDAIASRARPYDKAVAAACTYMHGFVLRHLLNLDRAEEGDSAVDKRGDESFTPTTRGNTSQRSAPAEKPWRQRVSAEVLALDEVFRGRCKERAALLRGLDLSAATMPPISKRIADLLGRPMPDDPSTMTIAEWETVNAGLRDDIEDMHATKTEQEVAQ